MSSFSGRPLDALIAMKIVHIEEFFHPSFGYQVNNFSYFHSRDHEVHIISGAKLRGNIVRCEPEKLRSLDREFESATNVTITRLPMAFEWRHKIWLKGLHEALEGINPDVIFAHGVEYVSLLRLLCAGWQKRCVLVADSHELATAAHNHLLKALYTNTFLRWCVRKINDHGVVCFYTAKPIRGILLDYGIREELVEELPLGTDLTKFHHDPKGREALRERWRVADDDLVILYTGKHNDYKKPHLLFEAVTRMPRRALGRLKVVSVGPADASYLEQTCQPIFQRLKQKNVEVLYESAVPSEQLRDYYSAADLAVFPAQSTLSSFDAMACELPVVMQDDEINRDRLAAGGRVFEIGNVDALARCLSDVTGDSQALRALGKAGRNDVVSRFSYEEIVKVLEDRCRDLVEKRSSLSGAPVAGGV